MFPEINSSEVSRWLPRKPLRQLRDEDRLRRRWTCRPVPGDPDEGPRPGTRRHGLRAEPSRGHARVGRGVLERPRRAARGERPGHASEIHESSFRWNGQLLAVGDKEPVRGGGHGYGIGRQRLLDILVERALGLGVRVEFESEIESTDALRADLIVACDGVNSPIRELRREQFQTHAVVGRNKYIWLGTTRVFDAFTFAFVHTEAGWIWCHAYGFDGDTSTFIAECSPETWTGLGFDRLGEPETIRRLEQIFERHLQGHALKSKARARRPRGLARVPDGHERELARRQHRAHGRRRPHDALHDRVGHEVGARGCDLARGEAADTRRVSRLRSSATRRTGDAHFYERRAMHGSAPAGSRASRVTSISTRRRSSLC